ncbi:MAG: type II secretion system protein GspM, partial [Thermodesulfobacteriota bacterium]|nr:type II secretion system protein GspM [Thermodesulfobacteriota bacterium]
MKTINLKLSGREKVIVSAGACFVALVLLLYFVVFPLLSTRAKLRRGLEADEERLKEMADLNAEYQALQKNSGGIGEVLATRKKDFTLFALLEGLAGEVGLKDRIKYIKPSSSQTQGRYKTSSVEMQLSGVNLEELFQYLYRVEDPKNIVKIKRISIKQHKEKTGYVDATL